MSQSGRAVCCGPVHGALALTPRLDAMALSVYSCAAAEQIRPLQCCVPALHLACSVSLLHLHLPLAWKVQTRCVEDAGGASEGASPGSRVPEGLGFRVY